MLHQQALSPTVTTTKNKLRLLWLSLLFGLLDGVFLGHLSLLGELIQDLLPTQEKGWVLGL